MSEEMKHAEAKNGNENNMSDSVDSVEEIDLKTVAGGWVLTKWCNDTGTAASVYHRGILVKKDMPVADVEQYRKICTYECRDCGRIMTMSTYFNDPDLVHARMLEKGGGTYIVRGSWD